MPNLFIEETKVDQSYQIVWEGSNFANALTFLETSSLVTRIELWSREHANTCKGFAPMAYRAAGSPAVMVGNTLKMLL